MKRGIWMNESKKIVGELKEKSNKRKNRYNKIKGIRILKRKPLNRIVTNMENKITKEENLIKTYEKWIADIEAVTPHSPKEKQRLEDATKLVQNVIQNYSKEKSMVIPSNITSRVNDAISGVVVSNEDNNGEEVYSDAAYKSIYGDRIKEIKQELKSLEKMEKYDLTNTTAKRMANLKAELKFLEDEQSNLFNRETEDAEVKEKLSELDEQHNKNVDRKKTLEEQKKQLEEMKSTLASRRNRNKVSREIKRIDKRLAELKAKDVQLLNNQKAIMYPIHKANLKRQRILAKAQGKINYYTEKKKVNDSLMVGLDENKIFDRFKANIYESRSEKYRQKIAHAEAVLSELNSDPKITYRGANRMVVQKAAVRTAGTGTAGKAK